MFHIQEFSCFSNFTLVTAVSDCSGTFVVAKVQEENSKSKSSFSKGGNYYDN